MATRIELNSLLESVGRGIDGLTKTARYGLNPFSDTAGFHIYGELNLTLKLTAAEETADAERLIKIFQEYATIGEACAAESKAVLLEVQGERIHFLLPIPTADENAVREILRFCVAFTNAVYVRIGASAGDEFRGFKMAVDHGRAILISSGIQANGSIVSLGPAANAPAKEMKRNGEAGNVRMRQSHYAMVSARGGNNGWVNVPIKDPSAEVVAMLGGELNELFLRRSDEYLRSISDNRISVLLENADYFTSFKGGYVDRPVKVRGFVLRADLDGFSKEVEAAFRKGDAAIAALVNRFLAIMRYPEEFRAKIGRTIDLPFAGDCATVIVLPANSGYTDAREFLPVKAAGAWHSQQGGKDSNKRQWAEQFGQTKWAVGVAGGGEDEGANGYIVVAPVAGRNRDFLVAAGWAVGRSLDGQESDGVAGSDTVLPNVDYEALATPHRADFKALNTIFWISHSLNSLLLRTGGITQLASTAPVFAPHIPRPVPQPRPYCE